MLRTHSVSGRNHQRPREAPGSTETRWLRHSTPDGFKGLVGGRMDSSVLDGPDGEIPASVSVPGGPTLIAAAAEVEGGWSFWFHLSSRASSCDCSPPSFLKTFTSCVCLRVFIVLLSLDIFKTGKVRMCRSTQRGTTFRFRTASDRLTDLEVLDGKCDLHRIRGVNRQQ